MNDTRDGHGQGPGTPLFIDMHSGIEPETREG